MKERNELNAYIQAHVKSGPMYRDVRGAAKSLTCKDGFSISVQASAMHYCTPRNNEGPYTEFELGFPSETEKAILGYAEDSDKPTQTVYGCVPLEIVLAVITMHGGLKVKGE